VAKHLLVQLTRTHLWRLACQSFNHFPIQAACQRKQKKTMSMKMSRTQAWVFLLAGVLFKSASAQAGRELCACFPSVYTFVFQFGQLCSETSISGTGVSSTVCFVSPAVANPAFEDEVPVAVSSIDVLELGQDLAPIASTQVTGDFRSGDSFTYASVVSTPEGVDMVNELGVFPGGIQLNINGRNALDEFITNVWVIFFDNECGLFPVISEGDQIGWTQFVSFALLVRKDRASSLLFELTVHFLLYATGSCRRAS
jgi:hypothetical protein